MYKPDMPLTNPEDDQLNRKVFAENIAKTLIKREASDPLVVGIYGSWGEGKTTFMNFIKSYLEGDNTIIIPFNPWFFTGTEVLVKNYFNQLSGYLQAKGKTWREIANLLRDYGHLLATTTDFPPETWVRFLIPLIKVWITIANLFTKTLEKIHEELKAKFNSDVYKQYKYYIFIDDIDRLDNHEILTLFKLVRLTANFPNFVYILALDDSIVTRVLDKSYEDEGYGFLDKIIQLPIRLPKADEYRLKDMLKSEIEEVERIVGIKRKEEEHRELFQGFDAVFPQLFTTPRLIKRYANALIPTTTMLHREINITDLYLIEAVRVILPDAFRFIVNHPKVFGYDVFAHAMELKNEEEMRKGIVEEAIQRPTSREGEYIRKCMATLFPIIRPIIDEKDNPHLDHDLWCKEKRIAVLEYLEKYLHIAVPDNVLQDTVVDGLLAYADNEDLQSIIKIISNISQDNKSPQLIEKLKLRHEEISANAGKTLTRALAALGDEFPDGIPGGMFSFSQLGDAAYLIQSLTEKKDSLNEILEDYKEFAETAKPLPLAVLITQPVWHKDGEIKNKRLNRDDVSEITKVLVHRISGESRDEFLFKRYFFRAPYLLWVWSTHGDRQDVEGYIQDVLDEFPEKAKMVIQSYAVKFFSTGASIDRFDGDSYSFMLKAFDPRIIYDKLSMLMGEEIRPEKYARFDGKPDDETLIKQFAYIFNEQQNKDKK